MKIAIIGATGFVGSRLLSEGLNRGHAITAIVREPGKLPTHAHLAARQGDVRDTAQLANLITGHETVISAFNPKKDAGDAGTRSIINAVKRAGVRRLLVVGGAGSLEVAPGKRLVDQPDFPLEWKEGATRTGEVLDVLREEATLDWVFLSPAAMLAPGERTGHYRVGGNVLLRDDNGVSRISLEDYAVAMLDEAEHPRHHRERFSVAY